MDTVYHVLRSTIEVYYGFWSWMFTWEVYARATLVIAVALCLVHILLRMAGFIVGLVLKVVGRKGIRVAYALRQQFMDKNVRNMEIRNGRMNRMSERFEKASNRWDEICEKIILFKGGKIKAYVILYMVTIALIWLPSLLENKVDARYINFFRLGETLYCSLEMGIRDRAAGYDPLVPPEREEESVEIEAEATEAVVEEIIWLQLTQEAARQGANLRSEPSTKNTEVLRVIDGQVQMKYIDKVGNWFYIELQDGTEGWIHQSLVEEV